LSCDCHEWHDTAVIGDWLVGLGGNLVHPVSVREWAATARIWEPGHYERLNHDELAALIMAAGRTVECTHALSAITYADQRVGLSNGVNRWAVANELGIERVPVNMRYESPKPVWAYVPGIE
jgi:hypothetical protein